MHRGYIKLWRRLSQSQFWTAEKFTRGQAWIDLLLLANHADGFLRVRGVRVEVKRGQVGWSEVSLSTRWKWSRGKTRRFLAELESKMEQKIEQQKSGLTTIITIINYDQYQSDGTASNTTDGQQTVQQTDSKRYTNKNDKNDKNDKNTDFPPLSPLPLPSGRVKPSEPKKRKTTVPENFTITEQMEVWAKAQGCNGDLRQITDAFIDHHRARETVFADWTAAWRTWIRNEIKFRRPVQGSVLDRKAQHNMAVINEFLSRG